MHWKLALQSLTVLGVLGSLGGCGSDEGSGSDSSPGESGVNVQVTGAFESSLATRGSVFCSPNDLGGPGYIFELYAMSPPQKFNLRFNREIGLGTHSIVGSDDPAAGRADAYFYFTGPGRERFDKVKRGEITFENIPAASGERLVANIDADVVDDDGTSITLRADIDVTAGGQSLAECP